METNVFGVDGGGWMDGGRCNASTLSLFGVQQGVKGDQEDANGIPALSINSPTRVWTEKSQSHSNFRGDQYKDPLANKNSCQKRLQ